MRSKSKYYAVGFCHVVVVIAFLSLFAETTSQESKHTVKPKNGFVPTRGTAVRIAEAVLIPIYGERNIQKQKPLNASLKGNVWRVTGTLPKNMLGGVALIEISKGDGRILRVTHGK